MAAKTIKGITVEIGGDTTKLGKALDGVTRTSRNLQGELKQVNNLLKLDPGNTDLLAQKQKILADSIEATKDKLDILREAQSQIEQQYVAGTIDRGAYLDFQKELINTQKRFDDLKKAQADFMEETMGLPNMLEKVEKAGKELREELNRVDDALKLDPGNTDLLAEKQKLLAESIENTKNKLQLLNESQEQITQQYAAGDIDRGAYLEFQQELADTKQKLKELQQAQKDFGTVAQQVMEQAGAKVSEYGEKMSTAGNRMLPATAAIGALGALAVNSGSDLIESQNKVDVAFGESSQIIEDFADTTLETYGIAKGTALDMAALFGDMGTSMGLTDSEAANLAQGLVGLSGDLASFKNIGVEDAQNALKGIFTGETESLKTLGIVMNETTLLQQAIKEGFVSDQKTAQQLAKEQINLEKAQAAYNEAVKKYGSDSLQAREAQLKLDEAQAATNESAKASLDTLSESEKIMLRYSFVMDATKNAQGDFANTSDGAANSMRTAQEAAKEAAASFGVILAPIVAKVAQYVTALLKSFSAMPEGQKKVVLAIAGIVAAIGPVLITLGKLAQGVGSIISLGGTIAGKIPALTKGIKTLWGVISANPFGIIITLITAVVAAVIYLWNTNENFRNFILMCWQHIQAAALAFFNYLANIFTVQIPAAFSQLTAWIAAVFTTDWTTRFGVLGNLVNAFFANVSNIFTALRTVFSGIVDFVKGVFTGNWSLAWEGVKKIFKGIFDSFTAIAKAPLNGVIGLLNMAIDGVNKLISGFNGIGFDMPDWLGGGSWHPSIPSIPNIPYLAKGGVLQEGEAIVAEAGPEHIKLMNGRAVVTPLSGKAKNTPVGGGIGQQTNNFYNYKPRDGEKVARDLNRRLGISVRPVRV